MFSSDAYEKRRPRQEVMHHYIVQGAGDHKANGEYRSAGHERNGTPIYVNQHGVSLKRDVQTISKDSEGARLTWVLHNTSENKQLYRVVTEDLSVPTLGWQLVCASAPAPRLQYGTYAAAARALKDQGDQAFSRSDWSKAVSLYSEALTTCIHPIDFAEHMAIILSSRADARLQQMKYDDALDDVEWALDLLMSVERDDREVISLRRRLMIRRGETLSALCRSREADTVLKEACQYFPDDEEIATRLKDVEKSFKDPDKSDASSLSDTRRRQSEPDRQRQGAIDFLSKVVDRLQKQTHLFRGQEPVLQPTVTVITKELAFFLTEAKAADATVFLECQVHLRVSGGMPGLLQILQSYWKIHFDGKDVDLHKQPELVDIGVALSLACEDNPENTRMSARHLHSILALFCGCNEHVDVPTWEKLLCLIASIFKMHPFFCADVLRLYGKLIESVSSMLGKLLLVDRADNRQGLDAPVLRGTVTRRAAELLSDWIRSDALSKHAVKGLMPWLVNASGIGLCTARDASTRALATNVLEKSLADPGALSTDQITTCLIGAQLLIAFGPLISAGEEVISLTFDDFGLPNTAMHYVDLADWEKTADGLNAAALLMLAAKGLEHHAQLHVSEADKVILIEAFKKGNGWLVLVPLVQASLPFSEPALLCLSVICEHDDESASYLVALPVLHALMGLPAPDLKPAPSKFEGEVLSGSAGHSARCYVARILARIAQTQTFIDLLLRSRTSCIQHLTTLASKLQEHVEDSPEGFHDMLHVFLVVATFCPTQFCECIPSTLLRVFAQLSLHRDDKAATVKAQSIVQIALKDPACQKVLLTILPTSMVKPSPDASETHRGGHQGLVPDLDQID